MVLKENANIKMPLGMEQIGTIKNIEFQNIGAGKWNKGTAILVKGAYENNESIVIPYCYQKGEKNAKTVYAIRGIDENGKRYFIDIHNIRLDENENIVIPRLYLNEGELRKHMN